MAIDERIIEEMKTYLKVGKNMTIEERIVEEIKTYLKLKEEGHFIVMSNDVFNIKIFGETTVIEFKDISLNLDKIELSLFENLGENFMLVYDSCVFVKKLEENKNTAKKIIYGMEEKFRETKITQVYSRLNCLFVYDGCWYYADRKDRVLLNCLKDTDSIIYIMQEHLIEVNRALQDEKYEY